MNWRLAVIFAIVFIAVFLFMRRRKPGPTTQALTARS